MSKPVIGVIGGSGLYELEGLTDTREENVTTPYGDPSDALMIGRLEGVEMIFIPRHGRGHRHTPSEINYRANIYALKEKGVTHIVSVSACGSLKEEIEPGHIVLIDQFFDRTKGIRKDTFFGDGVVGHVPFADPINEALRKILLNCGKELGIAVHDGGCYVCIEGPQFSSRSESHFYRNAVGAEVIGMTNITEAKLAREAGLCYATLALATDYDCWRTEDADVSVEEIMATMAKNIANAKRILTAAVPKIQADTGKEQAESAIAFAVVTAGSVIPEEAKERFAVLHGRRLGE
ncbi:MAG: S-methyl-5'-thioadenosine phosphorylase [Deltaproteobacteria bacterium]|nr:S-methyl-5'-thioadenosine phosphorylase [Deltaproteobacteria bacterium]